MGPKRKSVSGQAQEINVVDRKRDRNDSVPLEYGELLQPQYLRLRPKVLARTVVETKDHGKVTHRCAALLFIHSGVELTMAYVALACSMEPWEKVTLNDGVTKISKQECCLKALQLSPMHPIALVQLGDSLVPQESSGMPLLPLGAAVTALVGNKPVTRQECYLLAINCDPTLASAYCGLGNTLMGNPGGDSKAQVKLMDGTVLKHAECFRKAIELDPLYSNPVFCLFRTVNFFKPYVLPGGKKVHGGMGLIVEAFRLDPTNSSLLMYTKGFSGGFRLPDGRLLVSANEVALEALRIEPDDPKNYMLLSSKYSDYYFGAACQSVVFGQTSESESMEKLRQIPPPPPEMAVTLDDGRVVTNSEDCMRCMFESIGDTREAYECLLTYFQLHYLHPSMHTLPADKKTITLKDKRVISEVDCRAYLKEGL